MNTLTKSIIVLSVFGLYLNMYGNTDLRNPELMTNVSQKMSSIFGSSEMSKTGKISNEVDDIIKELELDPKLIDAAKSVSQKEIDDIINMAKDENITQEKSLNYSENRSAEELKSLKNMLQADAKKVDELADENNPLWLKEEIKQQEVFNSSNSNNESEIVPPEVEEMAIADSNPEKNIETRNSNINATENAEIEGSETDFSIDENVNNVVVNVDSLGNSESEDSIINNEAFEIDSVQIDSLSTDIEEQDSTLNVEEVEPSEMMLAGGNREKENKINHEIQLYGGLLNSSSNLNLSSDSSTFPMNTSESNLWSSSFGIMYCAKIKQFDLGAGLSWMKTGEKVNYSTDIAQYTDVDSVIFIAWQVDSIYNQNTQIYSKS